MPILTLPDAESLALTVRAKALLFEDPASRELLARIHKIAPSEATTLVIGETGTGKEIVARHVHERSSRAGRTFVAVNCGAFSETLVESELFGHERGAFTGATVRQAYALEPIFELDPRLSAATSSHGLSVCRRLFDDRADVSVRSTRPNR
jgi:sigma-54 dependent transcriptional regulator